MTSRKCLRGNKVTEKDGVADDSSKNHDDEAMAALANANLSSELPADLEKLRSVLLSELAQSMNNILKKALDDALAPISASLEQVKSFSDSHGERIHGVEEGLSEHSDRIGAIEAICTALQADNKKLREKMDDLENRSRRCNLRVVGIPEKLEGPDPVKFMTAFFEEVLGKDFFQRPLILSRAHRIGPRPAADSNSQRSRVFIVLFHCFQDKHRIITRKRQQLYFREHKVFLHEDVSADLGKKQAAFKEVKFLLYKKSVRFALIYPARLRVIHNGETLFFDTPGKAREFYDVHWGD